jgi:DNA invertase Pin-like site-specific DNA recombinase
MNIKVIGYIRVSTEEQATSGVSLDVQEEKIRAYCSVKDWELVDIIRDAGISAKNLKRPGIQSILTLLPKKVSRGFDAVIVMKLDRLTRSVRDLGLLNDEFKKHGVSFISIGESVDTSTAAGELFHNIVMSMSQWERRAISERTKVAMQHKKNQGQRVGTIPYGYDVSSAGKLVESDAERQVLKDIIGSRVAGCSYQHIANSLNDLKIKPKSGKKWYASTVRSVLEHTRSV